MEIFNAPETVGHLSGGLFIAGGISNCPDWQGAFIELLGDLPTHAYNPRRWVYEEGGDVAREQIAWEFNALTASDTVSFWFPKETLCPITLFELGRFSHEKNTTLFVGVHPEYARKFDVVEQMRLARPEVQIATSLEDLARQVRSHYLGM